jgi:hypothetical protein
MYTAEREKTEVLIFKMFLCKKILVADWGSSTNMAVSESYKTHQTKPGSFFCNGHHNCHVLEHPKERNAWLFNGEDPSVEKCVATFKRVFVMVIHRAKSSKT